LARGGAGVFEDDSGRGELRGEAGGEDGSHAVAENDEAARWNVADVGEPGPGGDGVVESEAFGGMGAGGAAKSLVVEGEDVDAGGAEGGDGGEAVGKGAAGVVEIENRGGYIFGAGRGGEVPAVELGLAGVVDVEVDLFEGQAGGRWRGGDLAGGVVNQLPLALVEEQAEGGVSAGAASRRVRAKVVRSQRGLTVGGWEGG
jgi:hypothetical protein